MKRKLLKMLLFACVGTTALAGPDTVKVCGHLQNTSGKSIQVNVLVEDLPNNHYLSTYSDSTGNYCTSVEVSGGVSQGSVEVSYLDCDGNSQSNALHRRYYHFNDSNVYEVYDSLWYCSYVDTVTQPKTVEVCGHIENTSGAPIKVDIEVEDLPNTHSLSTYIDSTGNYCASVEVSGDVLEGDVKVSFENCYNNENSTNDYYHFRRSDVYIVYDSLWYCDIPSSLGYVLEGNMVSLFPNPTTEKVTLKLPESSQSVNVSLLNISGSVVYSSSVASNTTQTELDLSTLSNGVYVVRVQTSNSIVSKQLIIK